MAIRGVVAIKVVYMFEPHKAGLEILDKNNVPYTYYPGREAPRDWLAKELGDALVLAAAPWNVVDSSVISLGGELKLIIVQGSGIDKVDIEAASKLGICVANAPDFIAETVADHIVGLLLAHYRNIVRGDRYVRERKWAGAVSPTLIGHALRGKRVGIIGMGRIGASVARRLLPFGSEIVYWDRKAKPDIEHALQIRRVELDELTETSDVIVISIALTPETRGLLNRERIFKMKRGALLINTARGPIIDERALIERLSKGEIYAALDVFEIEPLPPDSPLIELENVILTPHLGGFSWEALADTSTFVAEIIVKYVREGSMPPTLVNKC